MENGKGAFFSVQFLDFCTQSLVESDSNIDRLDVQFGQYPSVINSNSCSKFQPMVQFLVQFLVKLIKELLPGR